jgi:hypothetical protein
MEIDKQQAIDVAVAALYGALKAIVNRALFRQHFSTSVTSAQAAAIQKSLRMAVEMMMKK